jgi:hypothetical protein
VTFGRVMETIANTYGIPTIDLGVEVARREKEGSLVFRSNTPVEGKLVFSGDGVHPGDAGHDIYRDVIARSMLNISDTARAQAHALPAPLDANCWEATALLPIAKATLSAGWTPVDTARDAIYSADKGRTHGMLRGAVKCDRPGQTITVKWNGTTLGFSDIPYDKPSLVEAVIDGSKTVSMRRTQTEPPHKYARFWYLPELTLGVHTVTLTVKEIPEGSWFYAGQVLVIGTPGQ